MLLFSADATIFIIFKIFAHENMKKPASKVAHNRPKCFFFSVMPTDPNPAQISIHVP